MDIHLRKLRVEDGAQYRRLRLAALVDVPTLFIESQEEFEQKSMEQISSEFLRDGRFVIGGFDPDENLVGMTGFRRKISPRVDQIHRIF